MRGVDVVRIAPPLLVDFISPDVVVATANHAFIDSISADVVGVSQGPLVDIWSAYIVVLRKHGSGD